MRDKIKLHNRLIKAVKHLWHNKVITELVNKELRGLRYTGQAAYRMSYDKVNNRIQIEVIDMKEIYK